MMETILGERRLQAPRHRLRTTLDQSYAASLSLYVIMDRGITHGVLLASDGWTVCGASSRRVMWSSPDACIFLSSHTAERALSGHLLAGGRAGWLRSRTWGLTTWWWYRQRLPSHSNWEPPRGEIPPHHVGRLPGSLPGSAHQDICKLPWSDMSASLQAHRQVHQNMTRPAPLQHLDLQLSAQRHSLRHRHPTLRRLIKVYDALVLTVKDPGGPSSSLAA
jgi:hypothetical protein